MITAGTWYPPAAGTGGFLLDAQLFTNPPFAMTDDPVNHPAHYTAGPIEAIDVIHQAVSFAPQPWPGYCLGQTLKYLLRLWHKGHPLEDARKARWYLDRLIQNLEQQP